ncbi:tRNA 2-thiouridine(34) synthase MnmA [Candidatus Cyanaurora vandensis]|uniref:tRNA 2-thiouridine(34) synthase MnmA n=1 Tax=Candidatus Cyanaurora vandensis TaxID=2714958 RepID=UPI00257B3832|nr:tRNA 2-thiouridine(34) synthase MnmA [Candidatus Cyanaurora vandensis]
MGQQLNEKIVVGLSGGVDSSVAAALLTQQPYRVFGLTLWLMAGKGSCCSDGMKDAARVCETLAIPHQIVDVREQFEKTIIDFVVEGYQSGVTPLPCSRCNRELKFGLMLNHCRQVLGVTKLATGHYARTEFDPVSGRHQLRRAVDRTKDQSYFLYELSQDQLSAAVFPLGEMTKTETRRVAAELGLTVATKPESMDLCLVEAAGSMRNFLDEHIEPISGEIVDTTGRVLGHHDGAHHYTIGQRKGLGIAASTPLYVLAIDTKANRVLVGSRPEGYQTRCEVRQVNWVSIAAPSTPIACTAQIRYRAEPAPVTLIPHSEGITLEFAEPQFGITPGQAAVWYDGDRVLGGGIIIH